MRKIVDSLDQDAPYFEDAQKLRRLLQKAGISQSAAGRGIGMGSRQMRRLCTGTAHVRPIVMLALERFIEVNKSLQNSPFLGKNLL